MKIRFAALCALAASTALSLAPAAHAEERMLRVGRDIAAGDYRYTVVGNGHAAIQLCTDTRCEIGESLIELKRFSGLGNTGHLTITPDVKIVKVNDLVLDPMCRVEAIKDVLICIDSWSG
jgi:hypothetical protein